MTTTALPPGRKKTRRPGEWTEEDEALLVDLWQSGAPDDHLAEVFGRHPESIRSKARRMHLPRREVSIDRVVSEARQEMSDPVKRRLRLMRIAAHYCRIQGDLRIIDQGGVF